VISERAVAGIGGMILITGILLAVELISGAQAFPL
jgi:hypothetical protein